MSIIQARNGGTLAWGSGPGKGERERERDKITYILDIELVELSDRLEVSDRNPGQVPDFWLEKNEWMVAAFSGKTGRRIKSEGGIGN